MRSGCNTHILPLWQVILLFEILDYGPNLPAAELEAGNGFYRVAWGFLRVLPNTGNPNANIPGTARNAVDGDSPVARTHRLKLFRYQVGGGSRLSDWSMLWPVLTVWVCCVFVGPGAQDVSWWEKQRLGKDRADPASRSCLSACCSCCVADLNNTLASRVNAAIPAPDVFLQYVQRPVVWQRRCGGAHPWYRGVLALWCGAA